MAIGDTSKFSTKNELLKKTISIFGTLDLHSHIRIKPLIKYFKETNKDKTLNILEIGCGSGINGFEIHKYNNNIQYCGFDLNINAINEAKLIAHEMNCANKIKFYCEDAVKFKFNLKMKFDIILLMDFLEHINDPDAFLKSITHLFDEKTVIITSVPTYNYKKVFGEEFHKNIGHLKDGYNIIELSKLFEKIDYEIEQYSFNTGYFSSIGCFFYYRYSPKNRYVNFLKRLLLYPFKYIDIYNSQKVSCSLFAVLTSRDNNI